MKDYDTNYHKASTNFFGEIFTLLKNKRLLIFFSIATILVILITVAITSAVLKSRSNLDFVAIINEDLEYMLETQKMKSWNAYATIDAKTAELPNKYENLQKQSRIIEQSTNSLLEYISEIKEIIVDECNGFDNDFSFSMKDKGNYGAAEKVFTTNNYFNQLDSRVSNYKDKLLYEIRDTFHNEYKIVKRTLGYVNKIAEINNEINSVLLYENLPSIATLNLLTQLQIKIRIAEFETLNFMINNLEGLDIRVTALSVFTSSNKSIVSPGETYRCKIGLEAIDTSCSPMVYLSFDEPFYDSVLIEQQVFYKLKSGCTYDTLPRENGYTSVFSAKYNTPGTYHYGGLIRYNSNRGNMWLPFRSKFTVR
jgi:hypothetical protein